MNRILKNILNNAGENSDKIRLFSESDFKELHQRLIKTCNKTCNRYTLLCGVKNFKKPKVYPCCYKVGCYFDERYGYYFINGCVKFDLNDITELLGESKVQEMKGGNI